MERILSALNELYSINQGYDISTESIEQLKQDAKCAKVCTPIIGKFSSGKSALVNAFLGYSRIILSEGITPETSIPAEIVYSDIEDVITICGNDGEQTNISVDEYRAYKADAKTVKCARIQLKNRFLKEIPDVMIVDMPGFESGFEIHNMAIDNYLPQSMAYIVVFPADDMIVRSSVGNILKELCLHDIPLCVVITKYDKRNDDFDETFAKMKESLKRFVGDRKVRYCKTSSFNSDVNELKEFLKEIQEDSQDILEHSFVGSVMAIAGITERYLKTTLNSSKLSESELDEKEDELKKQLSVLHEKFSTEQERFESEASESVEEIINDVRCAMDAELPNLVAMAMNNQSIDEKLNIAVRNAVTASVKKHFIPKVEKYLKRVDNCINAESIEDVSVSFDFDAEKLNKGITSSVVAAVAGILIGLPLGGIILAFIMKLQRDKEREEAKQQTRKKLQEEVFPQVLKAVENDIKQTIFKQIESVNASINKEFKAQGDALEKAMADVRIQISYEEARKENLAIDIKADLERIGEIRDALR